MVKYLKYIVLVFGSLGILIGGFFFMQNKHDITAAWSTSDRLDYEGLRTDCPQGSVSPCVLKVFSESAQNLSMTGMGMVMKSVFNVMDEDKALAQGFSSEKHKQMFYSLSYLKINNIAIKNVYRNYFGYEAFYPGYIGSLPRFYEKAFEFSENIINGLSGPEGLSTLENQSLRESLNSEFKQVEQQYFSLKAQVNEFIEKETARLTPES